MTTSGNRVGEATTKAASSLYASGVAIRQAGAKLTMSDRPSLSILSARSAARVGGDIAVHAHVQSRTCLQRAEGWRTLTAALAGQTIGNAEIDPAVRTERQRVYRMAYRESATISTARCSRQRRRSDKRTILLS